MGYEIYKDIKHYPKYQVTSWGRVINKETMRFLAQDETPKGYLRVDLINDNGRKHFKVHRLVAEAFIPNPYGKPQVNHIDGNPANNSVTNLEWVTNKENYEHARLLRMKD